MVMMMMASPKLNGISIKFLESAVLSLKRPPIPA
jgi:hypothetical protein